MAKCEQCNGSNYDEWWMCADCYRSISFKELEQLKREYFLAGWKASADYIGSESEEVINKYLDIDLATYEASKKENHE